MFKIDLLNVSYGESHVIHDVSFQVKPGETLAIMGRNGMGKTTLLKSLIGLLPSSSGLIEISGSAVQNLQCHQRVKHGLAFVPQGRMVFPYLTVEENILSGSEYSGHTKIPEYIFNFFPVLKDMRMRNAGNLSGGQQQMLVIARALISDPKVLILDEPTEGIQPSIIKELSQTLDILRKERGFSIVLSEQVLSFALDLADRFLVIDRGQIVHEEDRVDVNQEKIKSFLTV